MRRVEALKPRVSFADLQRMPEDGNRYELYDGELRVVPSLLPRHEIVRGRIHEALIDYRRQWGGLVCSAPFDLVLSEFDVVQPDLIYFGPVSATRINLDEHVRFPPDLAVEVISPSTARFDRGHKRDLLARYALPELWIADPRRRRLECSVLLNSRYPEPAIV
ncbi:MAG: Uma2 family endonuclease, partial [Vicinamibacterales bacterium]